MKKFFLDTSYLLALELANDQDHKLVSEHWQRVRASPLHLVTTSFVFDEVVTFFNSRGHHEKAVRVGAILLQSPSVELTYVDEHAFERGWLYLQQHQDKRYSLTDCISFNVMTELEITTAFSRDHHFEQAGFLIEP